MTSECTRCDITLEYEDDFEHIQNDSGSDVEVCPSCFADDCLVTL